MMNSYRSIYVRTPCACAMPGFSALVKREQFEHAAQAQGALAKRRKPQVTGLGKYVARKSPALARKLKKALASAAKRYAKRVAALYADRLAKDAGPKPDVIAQMLAELNSDDLGQTLSGELTPAMLAAFKRAAQVGVSQVGLDMTDDITDQVDEAAVAFAKQRGGELIKDLAGTTDDALRSLLERAVEEGMSADELSDAVMNMGAFGEARADMIARTELAFAHVAGNKQGWSESGQVVGKRSLLGDLHDVADICDDAADAGVVGIDQPFVDGADDPPYHPLCVCDLEPVLSEDTSDSESDA